MELTPIQDILLSIITVVRNDPKRLAATMHSLRPLYNDSKFEHIVIDGNSNDGMTLEVMLKGRRYTNFQCTSEADRGIYDAMNKGVRMARGRFVLFLNCGDRMAASPAQLEAWLRVFATVNGVDLVCFSCRLRHGTNWTLLKPQSGIQHQMPTSHQAMVFARNFIRAYPYDIRYQIAADFNLYLSASVPRTLTLVDSEPLTDIESEGVASESPVRSYKEYLQIAHRKLHGRAKWVAITRIGFKAVGVVLLKALLPRAWVRALRRLV